MVLLQVVGAILLVFGSLLVLWSASRMDTGANPRLPAQRPKLVASGQRRLKARTQRSTKDLPRAA